MLNLLLDTNTFLWSISDESSLSNDAREAIIDPKNRVFVSAASTWEIVIKKSLGKLKAPNDLDEQITKHGFEMLPITINHTMELANLEKIHNDPFDRLLISQAKFESLTFITRDKLNLRYDIKSIIA